MLLDANAMFKMILKDVNAACKLIATDATAAFRKMLKDVNATCKRIVTDRWTNADGW